MTENSLTIIDSNILIYAVDSCQFHPTKKARTIVAAIANNPPIA